jgi:hypothetical protein
MNATHRVIWFNLLSSVGLNCNLMPRCTNTYIRLYVGNWVMIAIKGKSLFSTDEVILKQQSHFTLFSQQANEALTSLLQKMVLALRRCMPSV